MSEIRAIQTYYNGYNFRSRLEARWAVFFDCLGVDYEYEPEGFELSNGERYLPDFRVKCWGTRGSIDAQPFDLYIEVKGMMSEDDARRIEQFHEDGNAVLVVDRIPNVGCSSDVGLWSSNPSNAFNYATIDGDYFGAYPAAHNGKFYLWGADNNYINQEDVQAVELAYTQARTARFEWGETPEPCELRSFMRKALQGATV